MKKQTKDKISRKLTGSLLDEIHKLNSSQLRCLIRECEKMTQTNCLWACYWLKDVFIKFAKDRLSEKRVLNRKIKETSNANQIDQVKD